MSKLINMYSGGTVVRPWELDDLPDEWVDAYLGLTVHLPAMRARQERIDKKFSSWRKKHGYKGLVN